MARGGRTSLMRSTACCRNSSARALTARYGVARSVCSFVMRGPSFTSRTSVDSRLESAAAPHVRRGSCGAKPAVCAPCFHGVHVVGPQLRGLGFYNARREVAALAEQLGINQSPPWRRRGAHVTQRRAQKDRQSRPRTRAGHQAPLQSGDGGFCVRVRVVSALVLLEGPLRFRLLLLCQHLRMRCQASAATRCWPARAVLACRLYTGSASFTPRLSLSYAACAARRKVSAAAPARQA